MRESAESPFGQVSNSSSTKTHTWEEILRSMARVQENEVVKNLREQLIEAKTVSEEDLRKRVR